MAGNSFGHLFKITTFGESHGVGMGVIIDGCPAGLQVDMDLIRAELRRRKPGQSAFTTDRNEPEEFEIQSGVFEDCTLGTPIGILIKNKDAISGDYDHLKTSFRPSHADFTYTAKYGVRDHRGGGRSSARETVARVLGGAFAKMLLNQSNIKVQAYVSEVGGIGIDTPYQELALEKTEQDPIRCPDTKVSAAIQKAIELAQSEGDSLGGIVSCVVQGMPVGLGSPVFDKLEAQLAKAMMSLPATKGFEIGSGFASSVMKGSEHNDEFIHENDEVKTKTNFSGGVQGGISNGMDIYFSIAFKPPATIMKTQQSVDDQGNAVELTGKGRHDPCVVPRAVPIVESMAALVLADALLLSRTDRL